jgi:polygalacturonase
VNKPNRNDQNVIYFEGGKIHYPGIINVKSNQTVYIEGGAVVVGVIKAKAANNIKVLGRGVLDGTYNNRLNDSIVKVSANDASLLRDMKGSYHRFVEFTDCDNVTLDGITLHNSTSWQVVPINTNNIRINNIKIVSDQASDDGIDVVRSTKVRIENSFIRTKDDCVVIKAHLDYPKSEPVDDVLVQNCTFWNALWGNGIEIGFELNAAEIKNVVFRNNDIIHVEAGAAISIHNAGSGHVKNVTFENIRIEDARQKLFDFAIFRSQYSEDGTKDPEERKRLYLNGAWDGVLQVPASDRTAHAPYRGNISDIVLKNISVTDGLFPYSVFYGYDPQHNVRNVTIDNLMVHGKKITKLSDAKLYLEQAENVSFK